MTDLEAAELFRHMERWGYDHADPPYPRSPGNSRLTVAIRRTPTEDHYDPEAIHVQLCGAQGIPVRTTIQRETSLAMPGEIGPGQIELIDRYDVRRGFFTYGASIDRASTAEETVIDIRSPAPILELAGSLVESVGEQLASETEALWAKARVTWGTDDGGFMRCLGSTKPEMLYASTVLFLWETYQDSRILRQTFPQFYAMLRRELEWVKKFDVTQTAILPLDEILSP